MRKYKRITASVTAIIPASAEETWALLTDWAGILQWWPRNGMEPVQIQRVELTGEKREVPRTRTVFFPGGSAAEVLLLQDDEARRIYYNMDDEGIPGIRNYMATTTIDMDGPNQCLISFSSNYDIPCDADEDIFRIRIESVYNTIVVGFTEYFK